MGVASLGNRREQVRLDTGYFTFSLDFELAWGTRHHADASRVWPCLDGTRYAIDGLLKLFERYEMPATWAVVGAMFIGGSQRHPWLSDSEYAKVPTGDCRTQPRWYAEDILEQLKSASPPQDIGCHTLTHMHVHDTLESRSQFDLELTRSAELFAELGLPPAKSFIFPKHFMAHFDLLAKHGFTCFRSPESGWFERLPIGAMRAAVRLLWARLRMPPVIGHCWKTSDGLWEIPSSQYYPGFQNVGKWITPRDRVEKAKKGLDLAAQRKAIHHMWTHPFNLGVRTGELLDGLREIFEYADRLRERGLLQFKSMAELSCELSKSSQ